MITDPDDAMDIETADRLIEQAEARQPHKQRRWQKLLGLPLVRYFAMRWGRLKQTAFDQMYASRRWDFKESAEVSRLVLSCGKRILVVGGGTCSFLDYMPQGSFKSMLCLDLSCTATEIALRRYCHRLDVRFKTKDVLEYSPAEQLFDVIFFPESIYYLSARERDTVINRLAYCLSDGGSMIFTFSQPLRYRSVIRQLLSYSGNFFKYTYKGREVLILKFFS